MENKHLTVIGMILTVVLSIGGTWVSNLVESGKNQTQLQQLIDIEAENAKARRMLYSLVEKAEGMTGELVRQDASERALAIRIQSMEIANATNAEATENLVEVTKELVITTNKLVVAVAKLEK